MVANKTEKDEIRDQIAQQLSQISLDCSHLHTKHYLASNSAFKLDPARSHFEEVILRTLDALPPYSQDNIIVKTPHLFHSNREMNIQILEDLPNSINLKSFLLSEVSHGISQNAAQSLGRALGSWLRSFHIWATKPAQTKVRTTLSKHKAMEAIKYRFNYVALIENIERFPNILEGSRDVFEKVRDLAAAEFQEQDDDEGYGIIHGNFWTGK
ncbi:hypothetical protein SI65_07478 [Aspergillus cristatus]|uniref:Uncharacterized protein n=1 Tax=Aspergillus cristatus TaxID=573508 RepID=A0A1E3B827_ASPCR|nr:hypothetical protein SI65_07478 [Aspergillus cristatus]